MFSKVLVANRGEIAIRVMRACRELGIDTIAVFSDADKNALHAKYADEAYNIGPASPSQSYLKIDNIINVAQEAGAEAVHPGYGFLAENPKFASAVEKNGLTFIGPASDAMELMGSKIVSRKIMKKAKVPVVPGTESPITEASEVEALAEEIGYPVVLKASAGGGGIGMKVVWKKEDLESAIENTMSIAKSAFGDSTIFVEKYLLSPRHIEFQVMADDHGNTLHVGERECSIQRRHQKLIEESPSPLMIENPSLREEIGKIAVAAAESIDYVNAGTVELIYSDGNFYFLEMNTRLQVEHPVTERVTGFDLAREQILIAAGEELSFTQEDVYTNFRGHAIECRINAEDPMNDFVPSPGKITRYRSPGGPGVRIDSGVRMGYVISPYYDSMISKLITHGRTRLDCINRMERALSEYIIAGVMTNIPFHYAVMRSDAFRAGNLSTSFIEDHNIIDHVPAMMMEAKKREVRLSEAFKEDKKLAAISAAVGSYLEIEKKRTEPGK